MGNRESAQLSARRDVYSLVPTPCSSQVAFLAEALQAVAAAGGEDGDDVEDAHILGETHGRHDVGAMADPDLVRDAARDGVGAQALVPGDGTHRSPHVRDGRPRDCGATAAIVTAHGG